MFQISNVQRIPSVEYISFGFSRHWHFPHYIRNMSLLGIAKDDNILRKEMHC